MITLKRLRKSREARKLSRKQLAAKARVSHHAVYWAEHGRTVPTDVATRVASVLGVKLASLRS